MSTLIRVRNAGPNELVFTEDGRILEGFTAASANLKDRVTARLVNSGQLVTLQADPEPQKVTRKSAGKSTMIAPPTSPTEGE